MELQAKHTDPLVNSGNLHTLPKPSLRAMAAAGREIMDCERVLARTGDNIVGEVLRHQGEFKEWDHYPNGDVHDQEHHSQYYYHAHTRAERAPREHGHFHVFLRRYKQSGERRPQSPPAKYGDNGKDTTPCHLVGLSMDSHGKLIRLFTTNRWVTGETWHGASQVIAMLDRFKIDHARPSWPANRWITAMLTLFRPQIEDLVRSRDRVVEDWRECHTDGDVFEDRELNICTELWVTVPEQIRVVARALKA